MPAEIYGFGEFTLDASERRVSKAGQVVHLEPKAYDLLVVLLHRAGRLVTKGELLELVWPESFVEEGILAVHISALRKALGAFGRRSIETVPRAGYRFAPPVRQLARNGLQGLHKPWSVAVLPARPFTCEILSERDRSTGLALADALIDRLGRLEQIIVRPTRAIQGYLNTVDDPAKLGRALRVDAAIETQFLGTPQGVRVSVRLVRSQDGTCLWSGKFDERATDLLSLADAVAERVAMHAGSNAPERVNESTRHPVANPAIYEWVGRGRFHLLSASMFELPKAVEAFRTAIQLDPTYAAAHAGLALACCAQASLRALPPSVAYQEARTAALRALAMDDASADAQVALAAVLFFSDWNWAGAERSLNRALQLNPNHTEAYLLYGQLQEALGKLDTALQVKQKALERDPFSPLVHLQISISYWHQRRYDDAIEWANKTLELDPRHPHAREHLAGAYWKKGDSDRYFTETIKHAELHGVPAPALEQLKRIYAAEGREGMRKLALQRATDQPQAFPAMQLALWYGQEGEMDKAFEHLERAIESRDPSIVHLAIALQWDTLRQDPRFTHCLSLLGLSNVSFPVSTIAEAQNS